MFFEPKLIKAEDAVSLGLVHEVAEPDAVGDVALRQLMFLCGLASEAFAESKRMRIGAFCADVRNQMSA